MLCPDLEDIMAAPVDLEDTEDTMAVPVDLAEVITDRQWVEECIIARIWAVACGAVHRTEEAVAAVYFL